MPFPKKIMFNTDKNEIEFQEVLTHDGRIKMPVPKGNYKYTKSTQKLGFEIAFTETEIETLLNKNIITILK